MAKEQGLFSGEGGERKKLFDVIPMPRGREWLWVGALAAAAVWIL